MEAKYRQRGFTSNGRLVMSLYQAPTPSSSTVHYFSAENSSQSSSVASVTRYNDGNLGHLRNTTNGQDEFLSTIDETIDAKAAIYISSVRQRFRLD
ncbi:unnamed protein product [Dovyalis caffra]|uniref:Uncharacterized protein n=1 Tax=Dovyalis caffra TaxID=77055 RepID=A0AAV1RJW5_9ROSI|nr:unnamed protein product [Dovyalis caffra]